jgi:hypothetical protein
VQYRIGFHPEKRQYRFRTAVYIDEKFCRPYVTRNPEKKRGWASRYTEPRALRDGVSYRAAQRASRGILKRMDRRLGL